MNAHRTLVFLVCVAFALGIGVALTMGSASASPVAAADQSWTDPAGDAQGGAPDITAATVHHDDAGTITVTVTVPLAESMSSVMLFLDTNANGTFSDATDKITGALALGPGVVISVVVRDRLLNAKVNATPTTVAFTFAKAEAGIDTSFSFWIRSQSRAQFGTDQTGDEMPDGTAVMTYSLTAPPPPPTTTAPPPTTAPTPAAIKPVIGAPVATPRVAAHGRSMTVVFPVTRSDSGKPLATGTMICDPSVAGKVIRHLESFRSGKARLSFVVPASAKGKQLKVKVTIRSGAESATRVATFRVA